MPDIIACDYMNGRLLLKPNVTLNGVHKVTVTHYIHTQFGDIADPQEVEQPYQYPSPARVTNSRVVEVLDLSFDQASITNLPQSGLLARKTVQNCANTSVVSSIGMSVTGTQSWSITKTNSVTTSQSASVNATFGVPGGAGGGVALSFSQQFSTSSAVQDGGSQQVTRSSNESISIGPKQAVSIELFAYQASAEIPFSAQVVIDGDLENNVGGIQKASDLLSLEERTLPFNGVLRLSDVSQANLRTTDLGGPMNCGEMKNLHVVEEKYPPLPAAALGPYLLERFLPAENLMRDDKGSLITHLGKFSTFAWNATAADEGPTIGAPDGTSYEILYTTQSYEPSPACGFNDLGLPNLGIYSSEARQYRTYANGQLVNQWQETVKTFVGCNQV
ncbi:aerolysin family beta-barrel pore-forming toxin [Pseudomonas fluorescens]|uniref:aerolysin family beta-barrel pore-forming toxin n=1 Tax=Pseudomonas fluorescens TaxID=294 RepID=UPI003D25C29E